MKCEMCGNNAMKGNRYCKACGSEVLKELNAAGYLQRVPPRNAPTTFNDSRGRHCRSTQITGGCPTEATVDADLRHNDEG